MRLPRASIQFYACTSQFNNLGREALWGVAAKMAATGSSNHLAAILDLNFLKIEHPTDRIARHAHLNS